MRQHSRKTMLVAAVLLTLVAGVVVAHGDVAYENHVYAEQYRYEDAGHGELMYPDGVSHYDEYAGPVMDGEEHSSISAEQHVQQEDGEVTVERSTSGDGYVKQETATSEEGVSTTQHVYTANDKTTDDKKHEEYLFTDQDYRKNQRQENDTAGDTVDTKQDTDDADEDDTSGGAGVDEGGGTEGGAQPGDVDAVIHDIMSGENETQLEDNVTAIDANQAVDEQDDVVSLTPEGGARLIGDEYQTLPGAETAQQPETQPRDGFVVALIDFLQAILEAIENWFARFGTL